MDVERDVTVVVKTFERPEALKRLLASVRRLYERVQIVVVDDSGQRLDPVPSKIATYVHEPYNTVGAAGGRNLGLRHVETPYVLVCDDDMVFERRTDLGRMLHALESTSFDVVPCVWLDFDPAQLTGSPSSMSSTSSSSPPGSGWARTRGIPT
ncbi:MAG: glycosyltransferase family 2 protein [Gaiellaceae bacterium]